MFSLPYSRVLLAVAGAHALLALVCALALLVHAPPILGVHPALKPFKFAIGIASFLGTMAFVVPMLGLPAWQRLGLAWVLGATMVAEMVPIAWQALRGTTSHFNANTELDRALWQVMFVAIVTATLVMLAVAVVASARPMMHRGLGEASPRPLEALMQTALAAGLWLFQAAAVSGFAMGGRGRHTVGAADGGPGLPLVNWSTSHGDMRVSHFVALHSLQTLPLLAWLLGMLPLAAAGRWALLVVGIALHVVVVGWTLVQALVGRPLGLP